MKLTAWEQFPISLRKAWMIMRITPLLILLASLHLSANTLAQKISLNVNHISIDQFFNQLEKQTGYSFLFRDRTLSADKIVNVHVDDLELTKVLDEILKPLSLTYHIKDNFVYILRVSAPDSQNSTVDQTPPLDIHGLVTDSIGNPLSGASISVKGSKEGTQTDANGTFVIHATESKITLIISYTGYTTRQVLVINKSDLVITLVRNTNQLDQVLVIPYGTTTRRLNVGDISTVPGKIIEEQPVSNPLQALEGRVPGLYIAQSTGLPGSSITVSIRGRNSIANGNNPFYIIDGVPFTSTSIASNYTSYATNGGNPLNTLNPGDIESIEIMKDADATAIYGSRGANGVILITTKKGKAGGTRLEVNMYTGSSRITNTMKLLNTQQYLQIRHEAFNNDGETPTTDNAPDLLLWDTTRYTDWQKAAYGNSARTSDVQASVSGGNINTNYLIAGGFHKETTVFTGDFRDIKGNVHLNIQNISNNQKFKIGLTAGYTSDNNRLPSVDITPNIYVLPPDAPPIYDSTGNLNWANGFNNPFSFLKTNYTTTTGTLFANSVLSYTLLSNLELKANIGYTNMSMSEEAIIPSSSFNPSYNVLSGYTDFAQSQYKNWILEPQLNYGLDFHNKGMVKVLFGTTFQEDIRSGLTQEGDNFSSDALLQNIAAAGTITVYSSTYSQYKYNAFFGRLSYNLGDQYLFNLSARRDGSSRFGPGNQFANFGAIGAAWIFSKQPWIEHFGFLSFGKLRASYGSSGNDQIADYGYLSLWSPTQYAYQSVPGLTPTRLANPDYSWERNNKLEIGLDLGFLKDRLLVNASYYQNRSNDQLVGYPLPIISGQSSVQANLPAVIENKGFELEINSAIINYSRFSWNSNLNISFPQNLLLAYPNIALSSYANIYEVGKSLYLQKLLHSTGVNLQTGITEFEDVNGNGNTTDIPGDLLGLKEKAQKYFGGWQNSFRYDGWKLDIFFQFVKQTGTNYLYSHFDVPGTLGNQPAYVLARWQKPGDVTNIQKLTQDYTDAYNAYSYASFESDEIISDASFIRLKNIYLSYEFPERWKRTAHAMTTNIFVSGQNLLTITHFKGFDPESQNSFSLPLLKTFIVGIKLIF